MTHSPTHKQALSDEVVQQSMSKRHDNPLNGETGSFALYSSLSGPSYIRRNNLFHFHWKRKKLRKGYTRMNNRSIWHYLIAYLVSSEITRPTSLH